MGEPGVEFGVIFSITVHLTFGDRVSHLDLAISARLAGKSHDPPVFTPSTRATGMYVPSFYKDPDNLYAGPRVCAASPLQLSHLLSLNVHFFSTS